MIHSVLVAPFPSPEEANIAFNSLRVDPEPRKSLVSKQLSVDQNQLIAYVYTSIIMYVLKAIFMCTLTYIHTYICIKDATIHIIYHHIVIFRQGYHIDAHLGCIDTTDAVNFTILQLLIAERSSKNQLIHTRLYTTVSRCTSGNCVSLHYVYIMYRKLNNYIV